MAAQHYDAVVIGSGQGGSPALPGTRRSRDARTALIEREHVGGTCINEGCTPTKTMVASAKTAYVDRRSAEYGVHNGPVYVDMREGARPQAGDGGQLQEERPEAHRSNGWA